VAGGYLQDQSMRVCLQFESRNSPDNIQVSVTVNRKHGNPMGPSPAERKAGDGVGGSLQDRGSLEDLE